MKKINDSITETDHDAKDAEKAANGNRRDFLKKAGKFAVYTPPAVMMLMQPSFASNRQKGSWMGKPHDSWQSKGEYSWKSQSNRSWKSSRSNRSWKSAKRSWKAKDRH